MEGNPPPIPSVLNQPPSVDFIENQLPQVHDGFKNLPIRYDPVLKRFVLDPQAATMPPGRRQPGALSGGPPQQSSLQQGPLPPTNKTLFMPARELLPALRAMSFWNKILDDAMKKFTEGNTTVPKKLVEKSEYGIRGLKSWDDIHAKLQQAREKFDGDKSQFLGGVKKVYRYLIDKNDVARQALTAVPDIEYVSPVKAAVEVLLDVSSLRSIDALAQSSV
ncbi:uncharacterized protein PAC_17008 [Phialocephala subalpina]|uniref:Uncharacterized protein n=1 Tax=Phialocephala subalpina TaxID=576137 RepID=A0A1L7XQ09_9HELO|nr:uncharacterized protein PAC_17008 [Phialocephala subalpina]